MGAMATANGSKPQGGRPANVAGYWGRKVLRFAEPAGVDYQQMAQVCGVSHSTFGAWMSGDAKVPSYAVERLADFFGTTTDSLRTTPKKTR